MPWNVLEVESVELNGIEVSSFGMDEFFKSVTSCPESEEGSLLKRRDICL